MAKLALIQKWNPSDHGASSTEGIYLPYLQTKYLVHRVATSANERCSIIWSDSHETDIRRAMPDEGWPDGYIPAEVSEYFAELPHCRRSAHPIKKVYRYRDRDFAVLNYGLEKFQRIWRNYYTRKYGAPINF